MKKKMLKQLKKLNLRVSEKIIKKIYNGMSHIEKGKLFKEVNNENNKKMVKKT